MSLELESFEPLAGTLHSPSIARAHVSPPQGEGKKSAINVTVLALDLGNRTGWALRRRDGRVSLGTEDFNPRDGWHPGQRFSRFRAWLLRTINDNNVNQIAYERVVQGPHQSGRAGDIYGAFWGHMLVCAEAHNIVPIPAHTMTVKKHFTGSGRAKKADVIARVKELGFTPDSDNAADALAILSWAVAQELAA